MFSRASLLRRTALAAVLCLPCLLPTHVAAAPLTQTIVPGATLTLSDPSGSGRSADIQFLSGTGVYRLSNGGISDEGLLASGALPSAVGGLMGTINTGRVVLSPLDGATVTVDSVVMASGRKQRALATVEARVSSLTLNSGTGEVLAATSIGGAIESAPYIESTIDGGQVYFRNLRFDLPNKLVYADIAYSPLEVDGSSAPLIQRDDVAMWTVDSITGPTRISPEGVLAAAAGDLSILQAQAIEFLPPAEGSQAGASLLARGTTVFHGLRVTEEGFSYVSTGLGLPLGSIGNDVLASINLQPEGWGSITSNLYFSMPVPEPSTYALMGLGLLGVVWARKTKR